MKIGPQDQDRENFLCACLELVRSFSGILRQVIILTNELYLSIILNRKCVTMWTFTNLSQTREGNIASYLVTLVLHLLIN